MQCEHCDDIDYCTNHCPHADCIMTGMEAAKAEHLLRRKWKEAKQQREAELLENKKNGRKEYWSAYHAIYYDEHKEERIAYQRSYDAAHKAERAERKRKDRAKNPELARAKSRAYYAAHKDEINARARERRANARKRNEQSGCAEVSVG